VRIAVPREIKDNEYRVGLTPASVAELVAHGHEVVVERGAGLGSGLADADYLAAGARLCDSAAVAFAEAELIVKVKEPQASECALLRPGHMLFTYLHLAPAPGLTQALQRSGATCIAYETVTSASGGLPLLTPMSEVAGRLATQVGAHYLEREAGGRGVLLGGVPGVPPADVLVLGAGVAGTHAAMIAHGMGARVTVVDRSPDALRRIAAQHPGIGTIFSTRAAISELVPRADLVIGTVLVPGAATPKLVTREMVARMKAGAVIVDISADQGGCCETTRPTSHSQPTYVVDGVVHYCVTNMPGAVPRTSTFALNNATLPYVLALADKGWRKAMQDDPHLRNGLNVHEGHITCAPVAQAQGLPLTAFESL
jgi:alanine dehydrogenase